MRKEEFLKLKSDGCILCPECGGTRTTPYPGCHCPPNESGYGTKHINLYHHVCEKQKEVSHDKGK